MRCIEAPTGSGHWLSYDDGTDARLWCEAGSTAFASGRLAFERLSPSIQQSCLNTKVHYSSHPFQATYALGNSHNGLRVIDREAEEFQSFLNEMGRFFATSQLPETRGQVSFDFWLSEFHFLTFAAKNQCASAENLILSPFFGSSRQLRSVF